MNFKLRKKFLFQLWLDCFIYNNQYILILKRRYRNVANIVLFLTSPYLLLNWLLCRTYAMTIGKWCVTNKLKKEKKTSYSQEIAIVAIAKNEGLYLKEWIEYHLLVGIKKIYFYDNESEDNTKDILEPYIVGGGNRISFDTWHWTSA